MKNAGKARSYGLYRHLRTSKEIIENLLNYSSKNCSSSAVYLLEQRQRFRSAGGHKNLCLLFVGAVSNSPADIPLHLASKLGIGNSSMFCAVACKGLKNIVSFNMASRKYQEKNSLQNIPLNLEGVIKIIG